ncbi:PEP/pyruvate-binding domain-containing protein [Nonomuraea sp. NPDC050783]|uniref:PEP/pyruvate-binding domain-containing protein n=1 Tax=Nonomuraea sp. NPDC050783 TaxID=3154634 RepID=UPI003466C9D4
MDDDNVHGFGRAFRLYWGREPQGQSVELVGEKAAYLNRLGRQLTVPRGFSVTALSYLDLPDQEREAVLNATLAAYHELSRAERAEHVAVAVRPSPPRGLRSASVPTFLNISGDEALSACVLELLARPMPSAIWAPGMPEHGLGGLGRRAVLIQTLVAADSSARVYFADLARPDSEIVVRATWGLGENLAADDEPADVFVYDMALRLQTRQVAVKERMICPAAGGVVEVPVMQKLRRQPCLTNEVSRRIARQLLRACDLLGQRVRLGMAVAENQVATVSCRPCGEALRA